MSANAYTILEEIKKMHVKRNGSGQITKTLGYVDTGLSKEEFDEGVKYIQEKALINMVTVYENHKAIGIKFKVH